MRSASNTTQRTHARKYQYALADARPLRYRNGATRYFELLDAQRIVFAARQAMVQLQLMPAQNLVNFYKVQDGGWTDSALPASAG